MGFSRPPNVPDESAVVSLLLALFSLLLLFHAGREKAFDPGVNARTIL